MDSDQHGAASGRDMGNDAPDMIVTRKSRCEKREHLLLFTFKLAAR
jgi:hypothetical protein